MPAQDQPQTNRNWQLARRRLLTGYTEWLDQHRSEAPTIQTKMDTADSNCSVVDLPIALRKGKRRSSALFSPGLPRLGIDNAHERSTATTPARRSKRVRFSDSALPSNTNPIATGITPYLRRASLGTPRSRRHPTPRSDCPEDVQFTPFKQILDERVKRRIRRNGLSDEMNEYDADKKTKAILKKEIDKKDAELKRLRSELEEARSAAIPEKASAPPPASQQQVDEVEAELEALRQSFALEDSQPVPSWSHVPRDLSGPASDGGDTILIYEDDDTQDDQVNASADAESLAMGLELEAAKQAKQSMLGSFRESTSLRASDLNFIDSPARHRAQPIGASPQTPRTFYHDLSKQLKATTNRAEEAELALKTLETEVLSIGFQKDQQNASGAVAAILDHFRQARIDLERAMPGETVIGFENVKVLPELVEKLKAFAQHLKNKESELKAARDLQHNLKGNFEKAIVAAEKANARIKDLEVAIDSQAEDMLDVRMRAQRLEKDLAEKEKDVESLTTALTKYRNDISRLESLITQLEQDQATNLAKALSEHTQTISDLDAKVSAETRGRRAAEQSAVSRLAKINDLELALSTTRQRTIDLEYQITTFQSQIISTSTTHAQDLDSLNNRVSNLSNALTHANAEVSKLRTIKSKLEIRLRDEVENGARAVEAIQADLIRSVAKTNEDKKKYIRGAKVRIANWEMELDDNEEEEDEQEQSGEDASSSVVGPMTPSSLVRFADLAEEIEFTAGGRVMSDDDGDGRSEHVPGSVEMGRGKLRRSRSMDRLPRGLAIGLRPAKPKSRRGYDSGIGMSMSPVSEAELQAAFEDENESRGLITPDLSSECDEVEIETEHESIEIEMVV